MALLVLFVSLAIAGVAVAIMIHYGRRLAVTRLRDRWGKPVERERDFEPFWNPIDPSS